MEGGLYEMVEKAIQHYCQKYDIIKSPTELLTKEDKDALVQEIYNEELEEVKKANIKNAFKGNNIQQKCSFCISRLI